MAPPVFAPYDENGNFSTFDELNANYRHYQNPLAVAEGTNEARNYMLQGSLAAEISILENLKFKSTVSINYDAYNQANYVPSFVEIGGFSEGQDSGGGLGTRAHSTSINSFSRIHLLMIGSLMRNTV